MKRIISLLVLVLFGVTTLFGMTYEELFDNYCNQDIQYDGLNDIDGIFVFSHKVFQTSLATAYTNHEINT